MSLNQTNLIKPITIGDVELNHRVVHAPTSRARSVDFTPTDILLEYYKSRSRYPGSLIVSESIIVHPSSGLTPFKSGLWEDKQCKAWKRIADEIHNNRSFVSAQIFAPGRFANLDLLKEHNIPLVGPSKIYHSEAQEQKAKDLGIELQELTVDEIHQIQNDFVETAVNALTKAGFDFVELHGTSGFLIEQFLSPLSNQRKDEYGGSVENRTRFVTEILEKLFNHAKIGSKKVGIRITPWSTHNGMNYPNNDFSEPVKFVEYILKFLEDQKKQGNEIAYVSIVEPRVSGSVDADPAGHSNEDLLKLFSGKVIRTGGYATNYKNSEQVASNKQYLEVDENGNLRHYTTLIKDVNQDDRTLIGFSRPFTSNPDFTKRLFENLVLDSYNRKFFYTHTVEGYLTFTDYVDDEINSNLITNLPESELNRTGTPLA
ncbi:unnamed protein product [Candida verbasci]|uniref:NADH:flavin oxidoreductase/NADH oxidase N-terminal domain-containing protein n=1 Tax=Candida verbasci TaxID=1227364 RepID=A0A9W4TPJ4_9ASCO|nr:unnamed protein product [Candida verbasci]